MTDGEFFALLVGRLRAFGYHLELDIEDDRGFRVERSVEVEFDGPNVIVAGKPVSQSEAFSAISAAVRA